MVAAAKSLINFFRDICPQLLPKKFLGRDQKIEGKTEDLIYGHQKIHAGIEGAHLLKEGTNIAAERMLTDIDFKKIKVLEMRNALRK